MVSAVVFAVSSAFAVAFAKDFRMTLPQPSRARSILFLQGMASRFFDGLGRALRDRGHAVHRVNFNAGDRLFWTLPGAVDFRGAAQDWPAFLAGLLERLGVTDIVLFGDCRPLHRAAVKVAAGLPIAVHVCEEGYIRPHWVTFECDGVNGHSRLSRNPAWYHETAARLPPLPPPAAVPSSMARRAREDLAYNAAAILGGALYPHYQTHRPRHRLVEYAGWSRKVLRRRAAARRTADVLALIEGRPFYLLPLQLNCDSQIRQHFKHGSMAPAIRETIASFASHAPAGSLLVVKEHPLDDGLNDWRAAVAHLAAANGVAGRVAYLERGSIDALIAATSGVVTVNSTTGTLALAAGVPTVTLGAAIYSIEGLTHQGPLDTFWTALPTPDPALFAAFRRVLADRCLLAGGFFSDEGLRSLIGNAVARLEGSPVGRALSAAPAAAGAGQAGTGQAGAEGLLAAGL